MVKTHKIAGFLASVKAYLFQEIVTIFTIVTKVNVQKIRTIFSFCSQLKCWVSGLELKNVGQNSKPGRP